MRANRNSVPHIDGDHRHYDMFNLFFIKKLSGWEPESSAEPLIYINTEEDISKSCVYSTVVLESELFIQTEPD